MAESHLIVIGAPRAGKKYIVKQLFPAIVFERDGNSGLSVMASLNTKYYSAQLKISIFQSGQVNSVDANGCEILMLVIDQTSRSDVDITAWSRKVHAACILVVYNQPSETNESEDFGECIIPSLSKEFPDTIIEGIRISYNKCLPDITSPGLLKSDGTVEGLYRVKEVLDCHAWPNLVLNRKAEFPPSNHEHGKADPQPAPNSKVAIDSRDADMDKWDSLFSIVQNVKDRGLSLPDDARRQAATEAIYALMREFDISDGSDENDD